MKLEPNQCKKGPKLSRFFEKGFIQELCYIVWTTVLNSWPSWVAWVGTGCMQGSKAMWACFQFWLVHDFVPLFLPRPLAAVPISLVPRQTDVARTCTYVRNLKMADYRALWCTQCSITLEWSLFSKNRAHWFKTLVDLNWSMISLIMYSRFSWACYVYKNWHAATILAFFFQQVTC